MASYTINSASIANGSHGVYTTSGTGGKITNPTLTNTTGMTISPLQPLPGTVISANPNYWNNTTISSVSNAPTINWNTMLGPINPFQSENVKKYEITATTEDLLALSCTWHRVRKLGIVINRNPAQPSLLLSEDLFKYMTDEDRQKADSVREYYTKKLTFLALKDVKLTKFRQDMKEYLLGDPKKFTDNMIPLAYRLPEFYDYDSEFDKIVSEFSREVPRTPFVLSNSPVTLTPVKSFLKSGKGKKVTDFWLKDDNRNAYKLSLDHSNMMFGLWSNQFNKSKLELSLDLSVRDRDGLEYLSIVKILAS